MAKTKYIARSTVSLGKVPYEPIGFEKQAYYLVRAGQEFYADSDAVQKLVGLGLIVPSPIEKKPEKTEERPEPIKVPVVERTPKRGRR
jgi:hypothetical protein